jgi:hypothetical protein
VSLTTQPSFAFSPPSIVPRAGLIESPVTSRSIDISADGRQLLGAHWLNGAAGPPRVQVVLNWTEELKRLVSPR